MSKYIYSNKVASKRALQSLTINSLMGVDYSSSMVNIRDYHAYDIKNFLKKNNVLRNRNGFEQVGKGKINGLWECNYKGNKILIAHIGKSLYYVTDIDKYDIDSANYQAIVEDSSLIEDEFSWGVFANDRLYILCGNYCVLKFSINEQNVLGFSFTKVYDDEDTYIPTTTIGITFNSNTSGVKRVALDDANMLTPYRYNTLSSLVGQDLEAKYNDYTSANKRQYALDSKYISNVLSVEIQFIDNAKYLKTLVIEPTYNSGYFPLKAKKSDLGSYIGEITEEEINIGMVYPDGVLVLNYDFLQPDATEDNIIVKYSGNSNNDYELIDKCSFGVVYGANGNRNRLFLSGNPNKPNVDYHSGRRNIYATEGDIDLEDSQDFTYFSVYDYNAYGTSNSAVTDYQIMGNGDLMVIKEHNINEPNIYFRSGRFDTNEQGYTVETYPSRVGNIGKGSLKGQKGTLKNLNNDLVFASPLGIYGISSTVSAGMLNSDYQYAYARSNLINSKLKPYFDGLRAITAIIHDNKYFCTLKLKNGEFKTFVADGRYAYKLEESIDNEYEYEWFVLDNINAEKYYEINGVLYFTNENGFFKLDLAKEVEQHIDITKYPALDSDLLMECASLTCSDDLLEAFVDETSIFTLSESSSDTTNYYIKVACSCQNGVINLDTLSDANKKLVRDYFEDVTNTIYYSDSEDPLGIPIKVQVYVKEQEDEYNIYNLYTKMSMNENTKLNKTGTINILFKVNGKNFTFSKNENELTGLVDIYGNQVTITDYRFALSVNLEGVITNTKNVDCLFVTKAYNMGQSLYNKNLKSITVVNDAESYSWVNFAIRTKEVKKRFDENIVSGTSGLTDTYENIFKADLTDSSFATSFTKNYYLKFNFIQFEFYNNNGSDCIINNINVIYTLGFNQGGVS